MRAVQDLLPEVAGGDLAAVCSWADEVRFRYRWSSPLHYVNTPGVCNFQYKSMLIIFYNTTIISKAANYLPSGSLIKGKNPC